MPFNIEKFWSSPAVQAMAHTAQIGYLRLLCAQWQSEDGSVSSDPLDLAELSSLGDELWALHGPRILRKFASTEDGRLRNAANYREWCDAKVIFESKYTTPEELHRKRSEAGRKGNEKRWGNVAPDRKSDGLGSQTHRNGSPTGTGTVTSTKKQKTLAQSVPPEELAGTLPLVDGSEHAISKADVAAWREAYPAVDVKGELRKFKVWLDANPTRRKTHKGIRRAIVSWLSRAQDRGGGLRLEPSAAPDPLARMKFATGEKQ